MREPEETSSQQHEPQVHEQQPKEEEETYDDSHLDIRGDHEFQGYSMLKDCRFRHTRIFDLELLQKTGMDIDFANVWKTVGWMDFVNISELGSRYLAIKYLCTLVDENDAICFHLFGNEYSLSWKELSMLLGFHHHCNTDVVKTTRGFKKQNIWQSI
jgi:hypothetical protein